MQNQSFPIRNCNQQSERINLSSNHSVLQKTLYCQESLQTCGLRRKRLLEPALCFIGTDKLPSNCPRRLRKDKLVMTVDETSN